MIIVDAHMHVIPAFAGMRNEMELHGERYGKVRRGVRGAWRKGTPRGPYRFMPPSFESSTVSAELVLEYMDWAGVSKAVLMQSIMYGKFNEHLAEVVTRYPDRFVAMGLVDPRRAQQALDELDFIKDLGLVGVKMEPPDMPFYLDAEEYAPFWRKAEKLGLMFAVDLGWDPMDNPYNYQIEQFEALAKSHPDATLLCVHLGVSGLWDSSQAYPFPTLQRTLALAKYPNVWFDLTALQEFAEHEEYPYPRAQQIVKTVVETIGTERLIWGSDFPSILIYCTYPQCVNLIRRHCDFLTEVEKEYILGKNALRLFPFA